MLNIRDNSPKGAKAFSQYIEFGKQAKRDGNYKECIYWNCVIIIYNLTMYKNSSEPGGLTDQIRIALNKGKLSKSDFKTQFYKAYKDFYSDLNNDIDLLSDKTWNTINNSTSKKEVRNPNKQGNCHSCGKILPAFYYRTSDADVCFTCCKHAGFEKMDYKEKSIIKSMNLDEFKCLIK